MRSTQPSHRQLSEADWDELDKRADAFASAAGRGPIGEWEQYLDGLAGSVRVALLIEMIRTDMDLRWSQGRRVFVEDYVRKYPELMQGTSAPLDLILEEWQQRSRRGDRPDKISYLKRFPRHTAELDRLLKTPDAQGPPDLLAGPAEQGVRESTDSSSNYTFLERIGHGQSGEVWRARRADGVELAIKILFEAPDQQESRRELESLKLVTGLQHDHILPVHGYWIENRRLYIVMELAAGSLGAVYQRYRHIQLPGIPRAELMSYFHDAAIGLDFLHSRGICHRDVKPDNLLLAENRIKVADFGLARIEPLPTSATSLVGTPAYMPPEAWRGTYVIASDQYSLAAAYVELRTGKRAIEGTKFVDVMMGHLQKAPRLDGLASDEHQALLRALAKRPEERFSTCGEFMRMLMG